MVVPPTRPPPVPFQRPPLHHFDTYAFVQQLQMEGGFSKDQAQLIMEIMQQQMRVKIARNKDRLLHRSQLENEEHILQASMEDLRNAVMIHRRNDAAILRAELVMLAKEIDQLEIQLNEDLNYLQSSIDLTLNDFRNDGRQEQKLAMIETQQVNHRITVMIADANMAIERMRWQAIWQGLLGIAAAGFGLSAIGYGLSRLRARTPPPPIISQMEFDDTLTIADMQIYG
ncbi:hypothetical protein DM01DRAFT_1338398 [Hesseltinella vesiculosa]|uniref:DUF1640-domain-containing protein n=1 Tax=Hesseltinella vesiculosa TaxID=101127 RepID=A0A1X2G9T3_9FUNG|nr:hypothetical protein DM01DRAFT_1338398 [Hesseltinella vesiculosa]